MPRRNAIHKMVMSRKAPKPVGPYSHAVCIERPGSMLFVSGQIPIEVPSGNVFKGDIKKQADLALTHLKNIVSDAGFSIDEVVKCTIFLTDMKHFEAVNESYRNLFNGQTLPARAVIAVQGLPKGVDVEVEAVAVKQAAEDDDVFDDDDF